MVSLVHSKWQLRVARAYFLDDTVDVLDADVAFLLQAVRPMGRSRPFSTLHVDLRRDEDSLFRDCSKNNQYKIRRATDRDGLSFEMRRTPSSDELLDFAAFYDRFAEGKGLPHCDLSLLQELRSVGGIRISRAKTSQGEVLCQHLNIADGDRSRLLHSASHFREVGNSGRRSVIGRANRALHWFDIRRCKEDGLKIYDFGGFPEDPPDPAVRRINEFKASFGGFPTVEYHCTIGLTTLGRIALWGHQVLHNQVFSG